MKLGPYDLVREIGRGGMGIVHEARAPDGRRVAIKLLLRGRDSAESVARFDREARLLAGLGEPEGFVPLLDFGASPAGPFLVMPLLEGGTLRARIASGPLPVDEALRLARELARAVGHAHDRGIVHRDLKPENVLFDAGGRPLVSDLGLAKHWRLDVSGASQSVALTRAGEFRGTVGYCAPEQMEDAANAGTASDVFALGAIAYELMTGLPAFAAETAVELVARVHQGQFEPIRRLRPEVPRWLAEAIERALDPKPSRRPADARAFARALEAPPARRVPAAAVAAGGMLLVAAVLAGATSFRGGGSSIEPRAVAPRPEPPPAPHRKIDAPGWFLALPEEARPPFPLPAQLRFGGPGEYVNAKDGSVLVFVAGGRVAAKGKKPADLKPFFIGKYEVTNAQFQEFVATHSYRTIAETAQDMTGLGRDWAPGNTRPDGTGEDCMIMVISVERHLTWKEPTRDDAQPPPRDHPVVQIEGEDARAYCAWAGLALPTEVQWERAACGSSRHRFPWGNDVPRGARKLANLADETVRSRIAPHLRPEDWLFEGYVDGVDRTAKVGSFPDDRSPEGMLDVIGNVAEIVSDRIRNPGEAELRRGGAMVHLRRGGSWCERPGLVSLLQRNASYSPASDTGFRVALPLER